MKDVSCIIPAYNERAHIAAVLRAVDGHPDIKEVIVVDDHSSDGTGDVVSGFPGVRLITHQHNRGKSRSVYDGIKASTGSYIFLLDADLQNVTINDISRLIEPVVSGRADASISLRGNSPRLWRMIGIDYISGERVFPRKLIDEVLEQIGVSSGFSLEVLFNNLLIAHKSRVAIVPWDHVASPYKYKKVGWWKGIQGDIRMMRDIFKVVGAFGAFRQITALSLQRVRIDN
jgi:glycosyltransferase involved in cell wall biosynthesis